jgi:hypothetical protein
MMKMGRTELYQSLTIHFNLIHNPQQPTAQIAATGKSRQASHDQPAGRPLNTEYLTTVAGDFARNLVHTEPS